MATLDQRVQLASDATFQRRVQQALLAASFAELEKPIGALTAAAARAQRDRQQFSKNYLTDPSKYTRQVTNALVASVSDAAVNLAFPGGQFDQTAITDTQIANQMDAILDVFGGVNLTAAQLAG